jgi:hypothetical protein
VKLRTLVSSFVVIWIVCGALVLSLGDFAKSGQFGDSFGAVSTLFSGIALALAIYSMILQQRQSEEFNDKTLAALKQQSEAIEVLKESLVAQGNNARVLASTFLIEREEQRIETLKQWGSQTYKNDNYYSNGIAKAGARIDELRAEIEKMASSPARNQKN